MCHCGTLHIWKFCCGFCKHSFIANIMHLQNNSIMVVGPYFRVNWQLSKVWVCFIQQIILITTTQTIPFVITGPHSLCTSRQEKEIKASCWIFESESFMCVVSLMLSLTPSLPLCFRSLPGAKTVQLLCLPTNISKFSYTVPWHSGFFCILVYSDLFLAAHTVYWGMALV